MLVGNSMFLVLQSSQFSNFYIRPFLGLPIEPRVGMIDLRGISALLYYSSPIYTKGISFLTFFFNLDFMKFFGAVFIFSTTLIFILKRERDNTDESASVNQNLSISQTFKLLWEILKLSPVQKFCLILFTCKIAFATYAARYLKLIEAGVPKETLGLINGGFQIIQILTPILIGRCLNLGKPLYLFFRSYPIR